MTDTNNTLQLDGLTPDWITALRRFFITIALGNIVWEFAHMPLYTIWTEGTPNEIIFAGIHCTGGDILIAGSSLMIAVLCLAVLTGQTIDTNWFRPLRWRWE